MEQDSDADQMLSSSHEYPDPDSAAYSTIYPWVRNVSADAKADASYDLLTQQPFDLANKVPYGTATLSLEEESADEASGSVVLTQEDGFDIDSEYVASDNGISEDENISGEDSEESSKSTPHDEVLPFHKRGLFSLETGPFKTEASARSSGATGRGWRSSGMGRGGRGIKRGLRKPMEPGVDFKAHLSEATMAFTQSDLDKAETFTLKALKLNPEMFQAHNLLSEIHAARGDKEKALKAAWNGAHTRPRDAPMWARIANLVLERNGEDRETNLRDAIYCYARILTINKYNVEARYQRATLNRELGYKRKVAADYEYLLKCLPHDPIVLRHLAEIYIELNVADQALQHYENTIAHYQKHEPECPTKLTWSDVNIVAELYWTLGRFDEGISKLKSLSRWLLGRKLDECWETFEEDDREWDFDDHSRRIGTPGFVPGAFTLSSYGDGLPLELRIKLGVYRLFSDRHDFVEAIAHFEWLDPEDNDAGAKLFDYPDLFREAAHALRSKQHFEEALRYYEPLQHVVDFVDASLLMETALCHRAMGSTVPAEICYKTVLDFDPSSTEARVALWNMAKAPENIADGNAHHAPLVAVPRQKSKRRISAKAARMRREATELEHLSIASSAQSFRALKPTKKAEVTSAARQEAEVQAMYSRWRELSYRRWETKETAAWLEAARLLLQTFQDNRVFFPIDKRNKFYGYTKEARALANKPKYERDGFTKVSDTVLATLDGDEILIPDEYLGIQFINWLEIFLEYSLELARNGDIKSAYGNLSSAMDANVFYHSLDALTSIHVCWFTCALLANDEETLCNVARWFMTEYQFVTDAYRLFTAFNRLSSSKGDWYNCGPSQKFVLRQVKAMDFPFAGRDRNRTHFQERAAYTSKDSQGDPLQAQSLDVALLMLYGHILYMGKSYSCAVNYFFRALALDETNAIIKLSLALGFIHWAIKRHAENRHYLLMQGLAFLMEYYDDRQGTGNCCYRQEAEYNVGRAYHLLGLIHLAIPYYERCLELGQAVEKDTESTEVESFANEAALTLQGHWAASGNMDRARDVTERFLSI